MKLSATLALAAIAVSTTVSADIMVDIGISNSANSSDETAFQVGIYGLSPTRMSGYINFATPFLSEGAEDYEGTISGNPFNDPIADHESGVTRFNIGATYPVANFHVYGGIGYGSLDEQTIYYDPSLILASDGLYTTDGEQNITSGMSLNAGAIFCADRLCGNVGFNTFEAGVTLAIGYKF